MADPTLIKRLGVRLSRLAHEVRAQTGLRHMSGSRHPILGRDDVIVVALVRNGAYWLRSFLDHYRNIGAKHFVFIDNNSDDGALENLSEADCSVVKSALPWANFENDLRRIAATRFAHGHWCLYADMDEIFVPPDGYTLPTLAARLHDEGHTALVAQMLEMFPTEPLRDMANVPYKQALQRFDRFDLRNITRHAYFDPKVDFSWFLAQNKAPEAVQLMFGGIRKRIFDEDCCLTKHPLVFIGPPAVPSVHPHVSTGIQVAPFTALIKHYKFTNNPIGRDRDQVARSAIDHGEDKQRLRVLEKHNEVSLDSEGAQTYTGLQALYDQGFLIQPEPKDA